MYVLIFDNIQSIDCKGWRNWLSLDYNQFLTYQKFLKVIKGAPIKIYFDDKTEYCVFAFPIDTRYNVSNIKYVWSHATILPEHKFMYCIDLHEYIKKNNLTYYKDQ